MTGYIKGIYTYIRPGSEDSSSKPITETSPAPSTPTTPTSADNSSETGSYKDKPVVQQGYLKMAVSGVASGLYAVGSGGVGGAKWLAGSTYNVGAGVVTGAGSVVSTVATGATSVVGAVGSGASNVVSKVTKPASKEHSD